MDKPTRRSVLLGGAAFLGGTAIAGGAAAAVAGNDDESPPQRGEYIWAINPNGVVVPSNTWIRIPWPKLLLNSTVITLDTDEATWVFPVPKTSGIWAILCNVAWDNGRSPSGEPIRPPTHRKIARIPQQDVGTPQNDQPIYLGAATELLYHADLASRDDQDLFSDGSLGFQQQQVYIQTGVAPDRPDQRTWVEVYQDSGQTLVCRWDGSSAPKDETHAPIVGLQAPSLMVGKLCDF